jgi:hypothetical protein
MAGGGQQASTVRGIFTSSAATTTTITADALADVAGQYVGQAVIPLEGAMAGEKRYITAYNGTNALTVSPAWAADPDAAGNILFEVVSSEEGYTASVVDTINSVIGAMNTAAATGAVSDAKAAMGYIKQLVTAIQLIPTTAMRGTDSAFLAAVGGALADVAATGAVTEADTAMAYIKQLVTEGIARDAKIARTLCCMDFWSATQEEVQLTDIAAAGTDVALPTVTIADLPAGATIVRAIAMLKFRAIENTNVAENRLQGAQYIQVADDTPSAYTNALTLADDSFCVAASTREGGDVVLGDIDIAATVDGNDGYLFKWAASLIDQENLQFNDVQTGLRIWYSI